MSSLKEQYAAEAVWSWKALLLSRAWWLSPDRNQVATRGPRKFPVVGIARAAAY